MEFLKPVLGDALYEQVQRKLEGQKDIKLANLALGQYVDKRKFKAKAAALEKAEERLQTLEKALGRTDQLCLYIPCLAVL